MDRHQLHRTFWKHVLRDAIVPAHAHPRPHTNQWVHIDRTTGVASWVEGTTNRPFCTVPVSFRLSVSVRTITRTTDPWTFRWVATSNVPDNRTLSLLPSRLLTGSTGNVMIVSKTLRQDANVLALLLVNTLRTPSITAHQWLTYRTWCEHCDTNPTSTSPPRPFNGSNLDPPS